MFFKIFFILILLSFYQITLIHNKKLKQIKLFTHFKL